MLLGLYLAFVVALPLALGLVIVWKGMPRSRRCPACTGETLRLRAPLHSFATRLLRRAELHARWCPSCEWQGTVRLFRTRPLSSPAVAAPVAEADRSQDGLDIRRIEIDGDSWRVRLQCWQSEREWVGRLSFLGPDGQLWREDGFSLQGRTPAEVLARALTIPERSLAGRIRKTSR